jgi:hypothetical protein
MPLELLAGAGTLFSANTPAKVVVHVAISGFANRTSENAYGCCKVTGGSDVATAFDAKRDEAPLAQYDAVVDAIVVSSNIPLTAF